MVDFRLLRIQVDSSSVRRAQGDFKGFSDSTGAVNSGLQLLTRAAAGLGAALSAREIVQYADAWRNAENMLRQVTTSTSELTGVQAALKTVANETRSEFGATADLYARLARSTTEMGLSQQELIGLTTTINQSFAASGATANEAAAAITQLSQGLAAGALRGDEFNSVSEQAPGIMRAISESLGVTIGELRAMASEGAITADVVVTALQGASDSIESDFNKTMITFGQSVTVAQNNLMEFVGSSEGVEAIMDGAGKALILASDNMEHFGLAAGAAATVMATRFIPALAASTGPIGITVAALTALAIAYRDVTTEAEALANVQSYNIRQGARVIELAMYDVVQQMNEVNEELKELDDNSIDSLRRGQELTDRYNDLQAQLEEYARALEIAKDSQDETTESTRDLNAEFEEFQKKFPALNDGVPLLKNNIDLLEGSVGPLNATTIMANISLLDMEQVMNSMRTGVIPGLNTVVADTAFRMQGVTETTTDATEELLIQRNMIENLQREWADLIDTFIDGESDVGDFFDTFAKGIKRVVAEAAAADLVNMVFGGNQGGNLFNVFSTGAGLIPGGGSGGGGGGGSAASSMVNLASGGASLAGLTSGVSGFAQGLFGFGQGASSFMGPMTQSATFGANAGAFLTSPLGLAIGAAIVGKFVHDATNDPDGFHRAMAGMLVAPTPGAPGSSQFSVTPFASGFAPTGFADGPASQQQALELISQFRGIDKAIVDAVTAAGGRLATPGTLGGFGLDGSGDGTFLGRSQLTTDAEFQLQMNSFAKQLVNHIEGLSPEVIAQLMGATSAQEIVDILEALTTATEQQSAATEQQSAATEQQSAAIDANTAATVASSMSIAQSLGVETSMADINAKAAGMGPKKSDPSHGLTLVDDLPGISGPNIVDAIWGTPSDQFAANARADRVQGNLDMIARGYDFVTGTWNPPVLPSPPAPQMSETNALGLTANETMNQTVVKMAKDMGSMSKIIQRWEGDTLPANRS